VFRVLAALTIAAGVLCIIAALWIPAAWWQLALTGLFLLVAGAALGGQTLDRQ
jgi:hypothetical protein